MFKSFFESGTAFSEQIVPRALEKIGIPEQVAGKIGQVAGSALGLASVATGLCFLAAIPISLPMFVAATGWIGAHAVIASVLATGLLGGVGAVVTTTGIGMCRSGFRAVSTLAPPAPEKSSFDAFKTSRAPFNQASEGPPATGLAGGNAPSRKSANSSQLRNTASGA